MFFPPDYLPAFNYACKEIYNYVMPTYISGHGIDIIDLKRFKVMNETKLEKIAKRICTDEEFESFRNHKIKYQYVAKIWAGKEAISKAFGTGIRGQVTWKNIKISQNKQGRSLVSFKKELAWCAYNCHISFSHEREYLIASAILENVY